MGERAKQLSNSIAMACAARMPRRPVRSGDPQRCSGISEERQLGILAQARKYASPCVGDDEFEGAVARGVGDNPAFWPTAVLKHVVLQFAERPHQATNEPLRQPRSHRGVLGVLGPLLPSEPLRIRPTGVHAGQGKHPGTIACTGTANRSISQRALDLAKDRGFDHDAAVRVREGGGRHREFDQRPNPSRSRQRDRSEVRQPASDRLPQEIIGRLEARGHPSCRPLVQVAPRQNCWPFRSVAGVLPLDPTSKHSSQGCSLLDIASKYHSILCAFNARTPPCEDRFAFGVALYYSIDLAPFGDRLAAAQLSCL
jgi:hypothetical protein